MFRIGQGWDIHRLVDGRPLRLGGVVVPFEQGLLGHSDGDVVLHALTDALLGAIGAGDIGTHFPDSDPRWQSADSAGFLTAARAMLSEQNFVISNLDVTILAERPKLAPHMPSMRRRLEALLGVAGDQISLKAKTMEGLDAVGRGEAIAALAVVLIERR